MQLGFQGLTWRENRQVLRNVNPALAQLDQLDLFLLLSGAQNDADRRLFVGLP
jgi:hypothetical protein